MAQRKRVQDPKGASPSLQSYLIKRMKFFVAKVHFTRQSKLGFPHLRPIQIAFESPTFMLPIRLGTVNSDGTQKLFIYTLMNQGLVETTTAYREQLREGYEREAQTLASLTRWKIEEGRKSMNLALLPRNPDRKWYWRLWTN